MAKSRVAAASPAPPVLDVKAQALAVALSPAALAWEFLRRNPAYAADYEKVRAGLLASLPQHWGLVRPIDPDAANVDHHTIWRKAQRRVGSASTPVAARSAAGFRRASALR